MKQNLKKPTITIALSAFNEERNIKAWLDSVLAQREDGIHINKILIVSDGSTDATLNMARSSGSPKVEVWDFDDRIGKSGRLNQIYKSLRTDFLVQSDADVILSHPNVVRDLVQPLIYDEDVAMCGGNPTPVAARTFTEKAVNCTCAVYIPLRSSVRGGNNVFSADGRLLAYRRALVQNIHIPHDMIANDAYTYFCCISRGLRYRYVEQAIVHFRSPQSLSEHVKQNTRFTSAPRRMRRYFSAQIVRREYAIPASLWLPNILRQWFIHPLLSSYIFVVNRYCKLKALLVEKRLGAKWIMISTTKQITNESSV